MHFSSATIIPLLLQALPHSAQALPGSSSQQPLIKADTNKDGLQIPSIGLGLWRSKNEDATNAVEYAFKAGYDHLDSAAAYSNEKYVGKALKKSSAPKSRSDYWVTSKLFNDMHRPENVPVAFNKTLSDLGIPYLDLYLMHWPVAFLPNQKNGRTIIDDNTSIKDTWQAMEKLVSKNVTHPEPGTTRYIGISNFSPRQIDQLLEISSVRPYAHEFEIHPYLQQSEFVDWHHKHNITVIAYSPLANMNPTYDGKNPKDVPKILKDPFWTGLAKTKNVTAAQAILGWGIARDTIVIPKSVHEDYIKENLGAVDVKFTAEEMKEIGEQDRKLRLNNPAKEWGVELFEGLDGGSNRFVS